jgi:hypothetical protein
MSTTDKSTILRAFNSNFFDFINEIIRIFPDNADIATGKRAFEMAKSANPTILVKVWYTYIYSPYVDVIDKGDITFFFDKNYEEDVGVLNNSRKILNIIDSLRDPIRIMSDANKAHSMNYIQILSRLSKVYHSM